MQMFFRRCQLGYRFFSGFQPDAVLFGIQDLFEPTVPVVLTKYVKLGIFDTYTQFEVNFISSKYNVYSNISQLVVFPNTKNKIKSRLRNEVFQVVHVTPSEEDQNQYNDTIKEIWTTYLSSK